MTEWPDNRPASAYARVLVEMTSGGEDAAVCCNFKNTQRCSHGLKCKFSHYKYVPLPEAVVPDKKDNVTQEESDSQGEEKLVVCLQRETSDSSSQELVGSQVKSSQEVNSPQDNVKSEDDNDDDEDMKRVRNEAV